MNNTEIIVYLVVGLFGGGTLAVFVTKWFEKDKSKAETHNINITGEGIFWRDSSNQLQVQIEKLTARIDKQDDVIRTLREEASILRSQVVKLEAENSLLRSELSKYQSQLSA